MKILKSQDHPPVPPLNLLLDYIIFIYFSYLQNLKIIKDE